VAYKFYRVNLRYTPATLIARVYFVRVLTYGADGAVYNCQLFNSRRDDDCSTPERRRPARQLRRTPLDGVVFATDRVCVCVCVCV